MAYLHASKFIRLSMRCIHTALMYPACVYEMFRCKLSPSYVNSLGAHSTAVYSYQLTHGLIEWVEDRIFGPRSWRRHFASKAGSDSASPLQQVSRGGYARIESSIGVDDLVDDLRPLVFDGRVSHDQLPLSEIDHKHSTLRGRYDAGNASLLSLESFARLVTSEQVYQLASNVVGPRLFVTSALAWASLPCDTEAQAIASAQVFHMDYDYLDDVKLFINLSDVDASSGALEYVAGSHRPESKKIWSAEPISDALVWSVHPRANRVLFTGSKGSAYISDNRGLHRDSPPDIGFWKLAMQVNFSRSQFGSEQVYALARPQLSPEWPSFRVWKEAMRARPFLYDYLFSAQVRTL